MTLDASSTPPISLRDAFDRLLDLSAAEREAQLAAWPISASERQQLQAMLQADAAGAGSVLDRPVEQSIAALDQQMMTAQRLIGEMVGPFRVRELLGEGGSALVFRAERQSQGVCQIVALKVLRAGMLSLNAEQRFQREHGILAQLQHPNIARLIEGGVSAQGLSYLALELIDGQALTDAASQRRYNLSQRLALFLTLCRAISAAHAALIIHRDLKPSNVLLDRDGNLKVLDFGIGRLLAGAGQASATQTLSLTPEYAAPEQFTGGHQTVGVDIYALGMMLAELLTGQRQRQQLMSQAVLKGDQDVPAGLPDRQALARELSGDLDAIVLMATADEVGQRYASVEALAADIARYQAAEPVFARAQTRWYRSRRFIKRNARSLLIGSLVALSLLLSLSWAIQQRSAALVAAEEAKAQANRANSMRDFMFTAFAEAEPNAPRAAPTTVSEVVQRALHEVTSNQLLDPRARLELSGRLAEVLAAQGQLDASEATLASAVAEASQRFGPRDSLQLELALMRATNTLRRGDYALAETSAKELLTLIPESRPDLRSRALMVTALTASRSRQIPQSLQDAHAAVASAKLDQSGRTSFESLQTLAEVQRNAGHYDDAAETLRALLDIARQRYGDEHRLTSDTFAGLSSALMHQGDYTAAEAMIREALRIDRAIYPPSHWVLATHLNLLGQVLYAQQRIEEGLAAQQEGLAIDELNYQPDHPEIAVAHHAIGEGLISLGRFQEAAQQYRQAYEIQKRTFGAEHWNSAREQMAYGYALSRAALMAPVGQQRSDTLRTGLTALNSGIDSLSTQAVASPHTYAQALLRRARVRALLADYGDAQRDLDLAEAAVATLQQRDRRWAGRIACLRADLAILQQQPQAARLANRQCRDEMQAVGNPDTSLVREQQLQQAWIALRLGDADADEWSALALAAYQKERYPSTRMRQLAAELRDGQSSKPNSELRQP